MVEGKSFSFYTMFPQKLLRTPFKSWSFTHAELRLGPKPQGNKRNLESDSVSGFLFFVVVL
jgi:hypothetical protein